MSDSSCVIEEEFLVGVEGTEGVDGGVAEKKKVRRKTRRKGEGATQSNQPPADNKEMSDSSCVIEEEFLVGAEGVEGVDGVEGGGGKKKKVRRKTRRKGERATQSNKPPADNKEMSDSSCVIEEEFLVGVDGTEGVDGGVAEKKKVRRKTRRKGEGASQSNQPPATIWDVGIRHEDWFSDAMVVGSFSSSVYYGTFALHRQAIELAAQLKGILAVGGNTTGANHDGGGDNDDEEEEKSGDGDEGSDTRSVVTLESDGENIYEEDEEFDVSDYFRRRPAFAPTRDQLALQKLEQRKKRRDIAKRLCKTPKSAIKTPDDFVSSLVNFEETKRQEMRPKTAPKSTIPKFVPKFAPPPPPKNQTKRKSEDFVITYPHFFPSSNPPNPSNNRRDLGPVGKSESLQHHHNHRTRSCTKNNAKPAPNKVRRSRQNFWRLPHPSYRSDPRAIIPKMQKPKDIPKPEEGKPKKPPTKDFTKQDVLTKVLKLTDTTVATPLRNMPSSSLRTFVSRAPDPKVNKIGYRNDRADILYNDIFNYNVNVRHRCTDKSLRIPAEMKDRKLWSEKWRLPTPINKRGGFGIIVTLFKAKDPKDPISMDLKKEKVLLKLLMHGEQTVAQMRDAFICELDLIPTQEISLPELDEVKEVPLAKSKYPSAMMVIEDTVYSDRRQLFTATNYTPLVNNFLKKTWKNPSISVPTFKSGFMELTKISKVRLKLGIPYLYLHVGCCEHIFTFNRIRALSPYDGDFQVNYPRLLNMSNIKVISCRVCNSCIAAWCVLNHKELPENKMLMCLTCLLALCFDCHPKTKKYVRRGEFQLYPFNQLASRLKQIHKIDLPDQIPVVKP